MPGVSTEMKNTLGKSLTDLDTVTVPKIERTIKKIKDEKHKDSSEVATLATLKASIVTLKGRQTNLAVGGLDDKRYQELRTAIAKALTDGKKILNKVTAESVAKDPNAWKASVETVSGKEVDFSPYNSTFQGVLQKIVASKGGGHHGLVKLANGKEYLHWVSGSERIFGAYTGGKFKFAGYGRHGGSNSTYKVTLLEGGSTTVETS